MQTMLKITKPSLHLVAFIKLFLDELQHLHFMRLCQRLTFTNQPPGLIDLLIKSNSLSFL